MKLSVLIPVGGELEIDPWRQRAFDWVRQRWERHLAELSNDTELVYGFSDETPFNRSGARNDAFAQSTGDLLLVADADTMLNFGQVIKAIQLIEETGAPWVLPYTTYYNLSQLATNYLLTAPPAEFIPEPTDPDAWEHRIDNSPGGFQMLSRTAWELAGPWDEGFVGWSFEDDHRRLQLDRTLGPHRRVPGACLHLWHERGDADFTQPFMEHNRQRFRTYERGELP